MLSYHIPTRSWYQKIWMCAVLNSAKNWTSNQIILLVITLSIWHKRVQLISIKWSDGSFTLHHDTQGIQKLWCIWIYILIYFWTYIIQETYKRINKVFLYNFSLILQQKMSLKWMLLFALIILLVYEPQECEGKFGALKGNVYKMKMPITINW